jgi:hypothetical protein
MKSIHAFLFCLALSLGIFAQTNIYHPFPDSNAIWRVDWSDNSTCFGLIGEYQYTMNGDTTINSTMYHKIYKSGNSCDSTNFCCYFGIPAGYQGCIRNDVAAKRVWYIFPGTNYEKLLCDFSLQVGNMLNTYQARCYASNNPVYVSSIDSVLVGTGYRKRFNYSMQSCLLMSVVEGIGGLSGLFEPLGQFEQGGMLICYKDSSPVNYQYGTSPFGCNIVHAGIDDKEEEGSVTIFPDPSDGVFNIHFTGEVLSLDVFNIFGQRIFCISHPFNNENIDLTGNAEGIYLFRLSDGKNTTTQKVIIRR